ncbi:MAG TPA: acyltransferase [Bacteroidales bacterium]|nr:MAG: Acyl-protein synthetase, LuxE [Bacteroidetes bacterium ADurb.Bin139]HOG24645.1 acyltransferase [Bacteroidales bacterium]HOR11397.1 acyltransferase [Bacteroidales bacterium]HOZ18875.1 acyltransferase [Bacteroidales bacterium]HPB77590.1 acyltransferase [Bacteroidales bacterium]
MKNYDLLELFRSQARHIAVYARYLELLGVDPLKVNFPDEIPFLPIRFFKTHKVYNAPGPHTHIFTSSATTGMVPSLHYVDSLGRYGKNVLDIFRFFYGDPSRYTILALLPSYLERPGSSLVYMMQVLMEKSGTGADGFYLSNQEALYHRLLDLAWREKPVWLIGVAFALLDFVKKFTLSHPGLIVVETGGMKGRGTDLSREELHERLQAGFPASPIHSEYGMAELFSQAYACSDDLFFSCPPVMQVMIRNLQDPFSPEPDGSAGGINIIDLANTHSCSFIETEDLGFRIRGGQFQVLGRIPDAERRGCNMLIDIS